jgi:hypothetical protein
MKTFEIDILNPKAAKLLKDNANKGLIILKETNKGEFLKFVSKLRTKAKSVGNVPSPEEIQKEVDMVRAARYAGKKA